MGIKGKERQKEGIRGKKERESGQGVACRQHIRDYIHRGCYIPSTLQYNN